MHPELKSKRFGGKGKKKTITTLQQDLGSNPSDKTHIITVGIQYNLSLHANGNYKLHASISSSNESLVNERNRTELLCIRVAMKHTKLETLFDIGSQVNLISKPLVKKLRLETKPHTKPYPLGYVCDKSKVNVVKQCRA